jgi:hypothetical protein
MFSSSLVEICSFQLRFDSLKQMKEVLDYFEKKTHPSSQLPDEESVKAE